MPKVIKAGVSVATKTIQPGYPRASRNDVGNWSLEYRYVCDIGTALSEAPLHGDFPPSPEDVISEFSSLRCTGADIVPKGENPATVILITRITQPTGTTSFPGDVFRSSSASVLEKLITEHPSMTSIEQKAAIAKGRKTFLAGSLTYRRREILSSFTYSEANLVLGLNLRGAPTGLSPATPDNWLKLERNTREDESIVELDEAWQFDEAGWDDIIYNI